MHRALTMPRLGALASVCLAALAACADLPDTSPTVVRIPLGQVPEGWTEICYTAMTRDAFSGACQASQRSKMLCSSLGSRSTE